MARQKRSDEELIAKRPEETKAEEAASAAKGPAPGLMTIAAEYEARVKASAADPAPISRDSVASIGGAPANVDLQQLGQSMQVSGIFPWETTRGAPPVGLGQRAERTAHETVMEAARPALPDDMQLAADYARAAIEACQSAGYNHTARSSAKRLLKLALAHLET